MADVPAERQHLSRKEAADYLSRRWFRISPSTLAIKAMHDKGPRFIRLSEDRGRAVYSIPDLDQWARDQLKVDITQRRGPLAALSTQSRRT